MAQGLLEYETLTGEEIKKVIAGEPLDGGDDAGGAPSGGASPSVLTVPRTKPRAPTGGMEPEPSA
jgi:cell division protease FtsH